jgi:hypothetical protein
MHSSVSIGKLLFEALTCPYTSTNIEIHRGELGWMLLVKKLPSITIMLFNINTLQNMTVKSAIMPDSGIYSIYSISFAVARESSG